jgi:predicted GH43/DUF377 family glycosyl hydrolase
MKNIHTRILLVIMLIAFSCGFVFGQFVWEKYWNNPLEIHGTPGSWNQSVTVPCVIFNSDSSRYEMWFTAFTGATPNPGIGFTYSSDGINWVSPVLVMTPGPASWESLFIGGVSVIKEGSLYKMWYTGFSPLQIGYATSTNGGINWTKHPNPVLSPSTGWESGGVAYPSVIKVPSGYWMFYMGELSSGISRTGRAFSTDGINWQKDTVNNPILHVDGSGEWDQNNFLARVTEINDTLYMCYTGESVPGSNSTTAIGFATSADMGITWVKDAENPIITQGTYGSWDYGRIETGSILFKDDELKIYYDGSGAATGNMGRIGFATRPFTPVSVEDETTLPTEFTLEQNYPNPFNPSTKIKYSIPQISQVVVKVFDVLGNEIETLVNEDKPAGTYELIWNAADLSSGVYFYQFKSGSFIKTKKMILLK